LKDLSAKEASHRKPGGGSRSGSGARRQGRSERPLSRRGEKRIFIGEDGSPVGTSAPIILTAEEAARIARMPAGERRISFPCGSASLVLAESSVILGGYEIPRLSLTRAKGAKVLYAPTERGLERLQIFKDHLFKLVPSAGFPALEIDGIRMHRTKGIVPEEEARIKVEYLDLSPGARVLDICTGLGYSAQEASRRGAIVFTLEKNTPVIQLARKNPCSHGLFHPLQGRVHLLLCDAARQVATFPDAFFDAILHDPPSFSTAGELYSLRFYEELRRVIKEGGVVLHYTGQPGSRYRRRDLRRGVEGRMRRAGFRTRWVEDARSVLATPVSPRSQPEGRNPDFGR